MKYETPIPDTLTQLEQLVAQKTEESTILEFKQQLPDAGKNDDLARDLAAFANTEGGVLIYGIGEENGRAIDLVPMPLAGAAERVVQVARSIDPPVEVTVKTVAGSGTAAGFLIVLVHPSARAPHFVRGTALGRSSRGNHVLTRHRTGELFAKSDGFAEEFGIALFPPGRVRFRTTTEHIPNPNWLNATNRYLVFENDGGSDIFDVQWAWNPADSTLLMVPQNPFPLDVLHRGEIVRVLFYVQAVGELPPRIEISWTDHRGDSMQEIWTVTW